MTTARERHQARLRASVKATENWVRLGLDPDRPVEIFGVIEDAEVWLLFEPLKSLFGFFDRQGDAAGIVVHSKHPLSVQRFTAAHEFGHFALGHLQSQDTEKELFASVADLPLQEIEAQAFAAEFLMPLPVVNRALDRLGLASAPLDLDPVSAYQLSLEVGGSYRAMVTQLRQLNKIGPADFERLRAWEPVDIKLSIGQGERPTDPWADVWLLEDRWRGRNLQLRLGDDLHIRLAEIPSAGYRWAVDLGEPSPVEVLADGLEDQDLLSQGRFGARRRRHIWLRAVRPGHARVRLRLVRPWEPAGEPVDALVVPLDVQVPRTGPESEIGMSHRQRRAYLHAAA